MVLNPQIGKNITITCKQCCRPYEYKRPNNLRGKIRYCPSCMAIRRGVSRNKIVYKKVKKCLVCGEPMVPRDPQVHRRRCARIHRGWDLRVTPEEQKNMQRSFAYDEMSLLL